MCRVTSGGKSQFQYILHFVTPNLGKLAQYLEEMLVLVNDQLKSKSIALPAIGTGEKFIKIFFVDVVSK